MEPILFIVTGPSGVGKGSVMQAVLKRVPGLSKIVTYTTRPPRLGEQDGFDYHFLSPRRFLDLVQEGVIYEYEQVYRDHYYGSPRQLFQPDTDGLIELDYKGRDKYRARHAHVVSIFLLPPSLSELERRILRRSEVANLEARLANAIEQLQHAAEYDYIIKNDELAQCSETVASIVQLERLRLKGRHDLAAMLDEVIHPQA